MFAQAPQQISYQAVVRDANSVLVSNQAVGIKISILQNSPSGAAVYVETQTRTSNINGLVSLEIGSGNVVSGSMAGINWANGTYFIKTETDPGGGANYTISGTSKLLSMPYALHAKTVESITETDPAYNNSQAANITAADINNLNNLSGVNTGDQDGSETIITAGTNITVSGTGTSAAPYVINASNNSSWGLTGNAGTNPTINFIGTTDGTDLVFKTNNILAGRLNHNQENTSFGVNALSSNTNGISNTANGVSALSSNIAGNYNTANGVSALTNNTIGNDNTANGVSALFFNTTGSNNAAYGRSALYNNTSGSNNTANGSFSLAGNTTGIDNTANGASALFFNTTGYSNTANGRSALYNNTTGNDNTANGHSALFNNTTGFDNTATGRFALFSNTTGHSNTAYGRSTLFYNTIGIRNTASGSGALQNNTTGSENTANGVFALSTNTTGEDNTANGYYALSYSTTGSRNTAIGHSALSSNTTGNNNTATGVDALELNTTGYNNTAMGLLALSNTTTGNNNTGLGFDARVPAATASNQVRIGNTAVTYAGVQVAWTITSDIRWKENVQTSDLGLHFINSLNPVSYERKNDENKKTEFGFIAQELEKTLQEFNVTNSGMLTKDDEGMLSLRYNDLIAPMVKAIQELKTENDALKLKNSSLKAEIENLNSGNNKTEERLEKLEQYFKTTAENK
ncbi:MAG: hypothetical protein CVT94_04920 [Bacteroidetes bacterium HGW-Bacteroidetes-11]|nr:MAG: hypothetical protein CVT94_04920 [Bacteroidetes bacterium HGW-Bacteroidetes-11]